MPANAAASENAKPDLRIALKRNSNSNYDFRFSKVRKEVSRIVDVYMSEEGGDIQSGYTTVYIIIGAVIVFGVSIAIFTAVKRKRKASK